VPSEGAPFDTGSDHSGLPGGAEEAVFQSLPELDMDHDSPVPPPPPPRRSGVSSRVSQPPPAAKPSAPPPAPPRAAVPKSIPTEVNALTPRALLVAVGLAVIFGVGLRFISLPEALVPYVLPIGVGVVVTAGIILVLRLLLIAGESADTPSASGYSGGGGSTLISGKFKKPPRDKVKTDTNARLAKLARQRRDGQ
jgi:hypothetical protein